MIEFAKRIWHDFHFEEAQLTTGKCSSDIEDRYDVTKAMHVLESSRASTLNGANAHIVSILDYILGTSE
jgi:hypothetical protein